MERRARKVNSAKDYGHGTPRTNNPPAGAAPTYEGHEHQTTHDQHKSPGVPRPNSEGQWQKRFYESLKNLFIGARVEGQSGYINLMRIKAGYFEQVMRRHLQKKIAQALQPFPDFREELFHKLYTFFKRYFTESGSIGFFFTPYHQSIYEQVYTDDRDVMLFWKTARLYYVKTDRLFRSMTVKVDGFCFAFDVSTLEHKKANEKRELVYAFKERQSDGTLVFTVTYSEKGRTTRLDEIRRAIKGAIKDALPRNRYTDAVPSEETLERAFRIFERQSEVDYFICKDAKSFLREQFDLWMWQYLLGKPGEEHQTEWTETRLKQLQALKCIAYRVIDFIAAFEDELVKIWNKPKFVLRSGYVLTLDRIQEKDAALVGKLAAHPGFTEQVKEWQDLGMVDEGFTSEALWEKNLMGKSLHPRYRFLPIDTRYFKDLELEILSLFDNLDEALDGWLIKSENYQALNTILPKFRERVKCIYIDPPYNTAASEIIYLNRYKHSSWLSMMADRIQISEPLLGPNGAFAIAIDDLEMANLSLLVDTHFDKYDRAVIVINHHPAGAGLAGAMLSRTHEYVLIVARRESKMTLRLPGEGESSLALIAFMRTGTADSNLRKGRPNSFYAILIDERTGTVVGAEPPPASSDYPRGKTPEGLLRVYPIGSDGRERVWRRSYESCLREIESGNLIWNGRNIYLRTQGISSWRPVKSNWTDKKYNAGTYGSQVLTDIMGEASLFSYPKSVHTVEDCIQSMVQDEKDSIILDYFAGSGTTAHAVINLNRQDGGRRKYILVEMADYFSTVLLPRIKKVIFSDKWRDGKAQPDGQGISHFVKYYELEQYEDTLRRTRYLDDDLFTPPATQDPCQYLFLRDPKLLGALEVDLEQGTVQVDLSRLYEDIDLAETLSNLTGKWIKRIHPDPDDPTKPGKVEFADGTTEDLKNPDWRLIKPLIWW